MCVHLIDLTVGYADRVVLSGVTAHARRGGLTVLLGPAGVGKSTLLRTLADAQPALAGSVCVDGAYLERLGPGERSRRVALGADGMTAGAGLLLVDGQDAPVERLRSLAVERDIAVVVASSTPPGELRAGDTVWLLGRDGVLRTGSPRTLADRIRDTFDLAPAHPADRTLVAAALAAQDRYTFDPDADGVPLPALYRSRDLLARAVDTVADRLQVTEKRVAASAIHFGLTARLWTAALGGLSTHGVLPDLDRLRFSLTDKGFVQLGTADPAGWTTTDPLALLTTHLVDGHLRPLHAALCELTKVKERILWGNAASALVARPLHPDLVARLRLLPEFAAALGDDGKRRSCCLYYRSPVGGVCADCPLEGSKATEGKCVHCG